jgi:hypothetical protein
MASKKTQYIVIPANGLQAAENDPQQSQFFDSLYQTFTSKSQVHSRTTQTGLLPVKVLDSIGEKKPSSSSASPMSSLLYAQVTPPCAYYPWSTINPPLSDMRLP